MNCLLKPSTWGSSLYTSSVITQHLPDICKSAQDCVSWDQAEGSRLQDRIGGFSRSQKQPRLASEVRKLCRE